MAQSNDENIQRLEEAGVPVYQRSEIVQVPKEDIPESILEVFRDLSSDEVDVLIKIYRQLETAGLSPEELGTMEDPTTGGGTMAKSKDVGILGY
jgi:hypothetical protein